MQGVSARCVGKRFRAHVTTFGTSEPHVSVCFMALLPHPHRLVITLALYLPEIAEPGQRRTR